jgi:transposase
VREVAQRFGVSIDVVHYWIKHNVIAARQLERRAPCWITLDTVTDHKLSEWVRNSKRLRRQHSKAQL